jgi:translation initiation factor 5B
MVHCFTNISYKDFPVQCSSQDKRKKKKKGGKKEAAPAAETGSAPISAAAKAILLRRQQQEEEEARIKKLQEAEDERVRLEEERIAAEERAAEEEKERRRKAKLDKKEAQIAAGTFMTKAEKEKAKKLQARLEAMKAAGIQLPVSATDPSAAAAPVKASDMYKKPTKNGAKQGVTSPVNASAPTETFATPPVSEGATTDAATDAKESAVADDWDADDDWESNLEQISLNLEARTEKAADDVEDRLVVEKRQEQEKLRLLGIERAKREEEARIRK